MTNATRFSVAKGFPTLLLFLISRGVLALLGVSFGADLMYQGWQTVDPDLLQGRLVESIWYLHAQPPLFNLGLGLVYRWFPENAWVPVLNASFIGMGGLLAIGMLSLSLRILQRGWLSCLVTALFMLSPGCIVTENFLLYEYPTCLALVWTALFLSWFEEDLRSGDCLLAGMGLVVVVLLRSLFHLVWFVSVFLLMWFFLVYRRSESLQSTAPCSSRAFPPKVSTTKLAAFIGVPGLLVAGLFLKNLLLFGFFGSSSWFGMNLWGIAQFSPDIREIQALRNDGALSQISAFPAFGPLAVYRPFLASSPVWGIPVLDRESRGNGEPNLNHRDYLKVSAFYRQDALTLIFRQPMDYLMSLSVSLKCFFLPASDYGLYRKNREAISILDKMYNSFIYGMWWDDEDLAWIKRGSPQDFATSSPRFPMLVALFYPAALLFALFQTFKPLSWTPVCEIRWPLTLAFMAMTALYVTMVSSMFEIGENQRFRILVEPFFLLLIAWAAEFLWNRVSA